LQPNAAITHSTNWRVHASVGLRKQRRSLFPAKAGRIGRLSKSKLLDDRERQEPNGWITARGSRARSTRLVFDLIADVLRSGSSCGICVALLTLRLPGLNLHIAGDMVHLLLAVMLAILVIRQLHSL
jgi:hypothetical protein